MSVGFTELSICRLDSPLLAAGSCSTCLRIDFFWPFLTKTKPDQALLTLVYGKIWPRSTQYWIFRPSSEPLGRPFQARKSSPKLDAVGPNFLIDMTWEHLFPLSLSKKWPKQHF